MKKHLLFLPVMLLLFPLGIKACINLMDYSLNKTLISFSLEYDSNLDYFKQLAGEKMPDARYKELADAFYVKHQNKWTDSSACDYAGLLIMNNQLDEALLILDSLIKKLPENYSVNANYGTLMELKGNNRKALLHIRKAISIDPLSHHRSEWIHLRILEAKTALETDKHWLEKHTVADLGIEPGLLPKADKIGADSLQRLINAFMFQLHERLYFVKPQDACVADLFYTLGNIILLANKGTVLATKAYKLSLLYGDTRKTECEQTLNHLAENFPGHYHDSDNEKTPVFPDKSAEKSGNAFLFFFIIPPVLFILLLFVLRSKKNRKTN